MAHNIGGNRELLIDNALIDTARTTAQEHFSGNDYRDLGKIIMEV